MSMTSSLPDSLWIHKPSSGHIKLWPTGPPWHAARESIEVPSLMARSLLLILSLSPLHFLQSELAPAQSCNKHSTKNAIIIRMKNSPAKENDLLARL
jgi:hypothetical protein